jgi:2-dehydropantoate 2-reductase
MKVCIYGAGAVGGFIGTRLAARGQDVCALARGATAQALREHGLRLEIGGSLLRAPVRVAEHAAQLGPQDLVVIAVKGPAVAGVARGIAPLLRPDTMVLTAMNGVPWWFFEGFGGPCEGMRLQSVDPEGVIAAAVPMSQVIGCVVHATCSMPAPGLVRHGFGERLIIGEPAGGLTPRVTALAQVLSDAGFQAEISGRIQTDIWYKLWGNMTMNPITAITGATGDRVLDDPLVSAFCLSVMEEARSIGERIGCPIGQSGEDRHAITRKLGAFKTSMLQDVEAGRAVEIDTLVAAVREIGAEAGVATPNIDTLLGLARLHARVRGLYPQ